MKKIIIAPDSFKGTLSSIQICKIMEAVALRRFPDCQVITIPVADGGEGSVDCFLHAMGGQRIKMSCTSPHFGHINAQYGILPQERTAGAKTAVIEMAAAAGLPLVGDHRDPLVTTTYGVGEMIYHAAACGCRRIILGLGGSCTNDFGCGAAAALGVRFTDSDGKEFIPTGGTLCNIAHIDTGRVPELLRGVEITAMCDIDNPTFGENGAAYIFAPQKGADEEQVKLLDDGLRHVCVIVRDQLGIDVSDLPGGGAAGAMGAGMNAFFGAQLVSGIDVVLDTVGFDELAADADMIFTGEGRLDSQSLRGKVISGIGRRAKTAGVPAVVIAGGILDGIDEIYDNGIAAAFSINRQALDFSVSRHHSAENLTAAFDDILRLIKTVRR